MVDDTAFPQDDELTAIAVAYKNPDTSLIADGVFPRDTVGEEKFSWTKYDDARGFTVPDTDVGPYSKVPQVHLKGTEQTDKTRDQGVDIPLSASDLKAKPNARQHATMQATNLVLLRREVRAAALAFDPSQYASAHKTDLSTDLGGGAGAEQWGNAGADPIKLLLTELDKAWMRPNVLVFGQPAWSAFRVHPKVVSAALGNDGTSGAASRERIAELLEMQEVLVGTSWVNTAKPGKTPSLTRVWGKHTLGIYRDRTASVSGGLTYGLTAQHGIRVAGSKNVDMGLRGGQLVRAGESVKEVIIAPRAAHLFQNVVA